MPIALMYFLAIVSIDQLHLAASPSPTQTSEPSQSIWDSNNTDTGEVIPFSAPIGEEVSEDELFLNDDDEYYHSVLDPSVQKVYIKAMSNILHARDSLCSICLATISEQDAIPFERVMVTKYILEREYDFIRSIIVFLISNSESDGETDIHEGLRPKDTNKEICNHLVPKEVKRLSAKRLTYAKGMSKRYVKKGWDTTITDTRVKAYERLKNSLDNTPGDLSCNADYSDEVTRMIGILNLRLNHR